MVVVRTICSQSCINFSLTICGAKQHFVKYQFAAAASELHSPTACVIVAVLCASRALDAGMKTNEVMLLRQRAPTMSGLQCASLERG